MHFFRLKPRERKELYDSLRDSKGWHFKTFFIWSKEGICTYHGRFLQRPKNEESICCGDILCWGICPGPHSAWDIGDDCQRRILRTKVKIVAVSKEVGITTKSTVDLRRVLDERGSILHDSIHLFREMKQCFDETLVS